MKNILFTCLAAVMLSSCVNSINPLFTQEDFVYDDRIPGKKVNMKGEIWEVIEARDTTSQGVIELNGYQAAYYSKGMMATFWLGVGEINGQYYAQLFPIELESLDSLKKDDWDIETYWNHMVPSFSISKLDFKGNSMLFRPLSYDYLDDAIDAGKLTIKHSENFNGLVLTAETKELQRMIKEIGKEEKAFEEDEVFLKKSD